MKKIKNTFNAPVVLGFAAICFIATLLNYLTNGKSNHMIFMTYHSSLMSPLTYLRLFTHVFGHDGWQNFIGNMAYILLLGPMLEENKNFGTIFSKAQTIYYLVCFLQTFFHLVQIILFKIPRNT